MKALNKFLAKRDDLDAALVKRIERGWDGLDGLWAYVSKNTAQIRATLDTCQKTAADSDEAFERGEDPRPQIGNLVGQLRRQLRSLQFPLQDTASALNTLANAAGALADDLNVLIKKL